MIQKISIFDIMYDKYKITKPVRLIELFAGYGSQALALKYLGVPFTHYRICEWAVNSIIAYADIHQDELQDYGKDFCGNLTKDQIAEELFNLGVSIDYNQPAKLNQLKRMAEDKLRLTFNSIKWCNNLVDISRVKDLEIVDRDKYEYITTYSFPCQDLSLAGLGKGMSRDGNTRSGLLWQVERILKNCGNNLPQILLMENVPQVVGKNNIEDFKDWQRFLETIGYTNYVELLNAKNYGIPQNRQRCFMISFLGEYSYNFPKREKLKLKLKDMLEDEVDEKYYLSQKMIDCFLSDGTGTYPRRERFLQNIGRKNKDIGNSVTTLAGSRATDNFVIEDMPNQRLRETLNENDVEDGDFIDTYNRKVKKDVAGTITTRASESNNTFIVEKTLDTNFLKIKNATKQGYLVAKDGDGVDINTRMKYHRGTVQKGMVQTITTTGGNDRGVVVVGNYSPSDHNASRVVDPDGIAPTVMENHGTVTSILDKGNYIQWQQKGHLDIDCRAYKQDKLGPTIITNPKSKVLLSDLRIRKLTPKECWRLMGVKDEDYEKVKRNQSNASLYHLAGDSIVVNVLMGIFKELV